MRPLRYGVNVTLDGCVHHEAGLPPDAESMAVWTEELAAGEVLLYGRTTYPMMESAWRRPASGGWPGWMDASEVAFAEVIDALPKVVVSGTLGSVDWKATLLLAGLPAPLRLEVHERRVLGSGAVVQRHRLR